jgi:hypothetical protein
MPRLSKKDQEYINRAFELAYFIIPDKSIGLRVVEDAWCSLDLVLGRQEKRRKTYWRLLGYVKGEERSRPVRTKIRLSEEQMLQWLVYAHSDSWERATEYGDSLYSPRMEDMIVRYIKHLVRITSNRNSFYVTLGITRLLYKYGTQEVRLMYDVLTASDSARMKDMKYLRKQKVLLMDEVLMRFDGLLATVATAYREKRFESQPTTERSIRLVKECMRRFTPWGTSCTVTEGFDPTAVSGLYFSGASLADEDLIETSRIHAILHPDCFSQFVKGLSKFIDELPQDSPDKNCRFGAPEDSLAVPQFQIFANRDPQDDRFDPPKLGPADYLRLERSREGMARRRKMHLPHRLCVCVDDIERVWFNPKRTTRVNLELDPGERVIEVRGEDAHGVLPMAILIVCNDIPSGGSFRDSIVLEAGQKVTIQLRPMRNLNGESEKVSVEVVYAETALIRAIFWYGQRAWQGLSETIRHHEGPDDVRRDYSWLGKASVLVALMVAAVIWFELRLPIKAPSSIEVRPPLAGEIKPDSSAPAPVAPTIPVRKPEPKLIARATWSRNAETGRQAFRLETERGAVARVEVPNRQGKISVALPQSDTEGHAYTSYRVTLLAADNTIWQQTLLPPKFRLSPHSHVLDVLLSSPSQTEADPFMLRFQGKTRSGWQPLGHVTLRRISR